MMMRMPRVCRICLHNPETGNAKIDVKHAEKATDTGELGIGPATAHFKGTGWQHHDVAHRTNT